MFKLTTIAATVMLVVSASAAFAGKPADRGPTPGLGWGPGGSKGHTVGVPGPIAGVGLPILAIVGGVVWVRRQRRKAQDDQQTMP